MKMYVVVCIRHEQHMQDILIFIELGTNIY